MTRRDPTTKCPRCGVGDLVELSYTGGSPADLGRPVQQASTRQVETYSCGHEVIGPRLSRADDTLDVERRSSEETAEPRPRPR